MTYLPNIPQPGDLISVSQNDILVNFQQLNAVYTADHYAYNDATANAQRHRQVRLPELAAAPAAAADMGSVYTADVAGITELFYRYDNSATPASRIMQLSCIKAWCRFNGTLATPIAIIDGMNVTNVTRPVGVGTYQVNFARPLGNANFIVLVNIGVVFPAPTLITNITATTVNDCTFEVRRTLNSALNDATIVNVLIIGN